MNHFNRRDFIKLCGGSIAIAAIPFSGKSSAATTGPRVVVIGGGFAGASAAKYLRMWGSNISVALVDPATSHVSCIGSNLVLNGETTLSKLTRSFTTLRDVYGVQLVTGSATQIDPLAHRIYLASGEKLDYDYVIVAPGIDFDPVPGHDYNVMPHAWIAGSQTTLLTNQLNAMPNGGTFVLTIPPTPFRAHSGPYERACVVADIFKRTKPNSKVMILDANANIAAMKTTFTTAFTGVYANTIKYVPGVSVISADAATMSINTSIGIINGNVINIIPKQRAGSIVFNSGLVPAGSNFAPVNPLNYESTLFSNVHILGDAQATGQAKSGHMANSQAKVCADAIVRSIAGLAPDPAPKTSAASFPPITYTTASWGTTTYAYDPASKLMKAVAGTPAESTSPSGDIYEQGNGWLTNLLSDSFT